MAVMSCDREIGYLFGDPQLADDLTVEEWLVSAERSRMEKYDVQATGQRSLLGVCFEPACALLHDARPAAARELFQSILVPEHRPSIARVLAYIGNGRALNVWRRYAAADASLSRAMRDVAELDEPLLLLTARILWALNASDMGAPVSWEPLFETELTGADARLTLLIDVMRTYVAARVCFRSGRRTAGIELCERAVANPSFRGVAAIPRGLLLRMFGILYSTMGQPAAAQQYLEDALAVFRKAGYVCGEVHAAFSLARLNAPIDRQQMAIYLGRAKEILEDTDDDRAPPRSSARQMPGERAELLSRLAELEFRRGNLAKALEYYARDLEFSRTLDNAPRSVAYASRSLGRNLLAMKRYSEATTYLEMSATLFEQVKDDHNVFFTLYLLGDAYLEQRELEKASRLVARMSRLIDGNPDRDKETCILDVFRAQVLWKHELEAERALGVISAARHGLRRFDTDFHYVRALLVEGELQLHIRDVASARWCLREARRLAVSRELEDLRRRADELLGDTGPLLEPEPRGRIALAILYADLRGFTRVCQEIEPTMMAEFIAEFAEMIGQQASRFEGKPVRFLGDCVMAVFGLHETPRPKERLALEAACSMNERFKHQRQRWGGRHASLGEIGIGFGISTGAVIADRFGSGELSEYSMIGDAVNLAARLQGWAEQEEIIVSNDAFAAIHDTITSLPFTYRDCQLKGYNGAHGNGQVRVRVFHGPTILPMVQRDRSLGSGDRLRSNISIRR